MLSRRYSLPFAIAGLTFALSGCFSSSSSSSDPDSPSDPSINTDNLMSSTSDLEGTQQGTLQDAPVEGLTYWTASAGRQQTGEGGSFEFEPGEVVVFRLGGERLVATDAELISTPLDTLAINRVLQGSDGEGHPDEAINTLRLLQTIDKQPNDDSVIEIADSFHSDNYLAEDQEKYFNPNLSSGEFANSDAVADVLERSGRQAEDLVGYAQAAEHFEHSLDRLENADIDLRGEWHLSTMHLEDFETTSPNEGCEFEQRSTLIIDDTTGFQFGEELNTGEDGCEEVNFGDSEYDADNVVTRDGNTGVEWSLAENGIIDVDCGPICSLSELRKTTNDWDAMCLSDSFPYGENQEWSFDDLEYCDDSDSHNGPIMAFSEVNFVDRLGGDRLIRIKRDFSANTQYAPESPDAERADSFSEQGFFLTAYDRAETKNYTVDLSSSSWKETAMSSKETDPFHEDKLVSFGSEDGQEPFHDGFCEDMSACTWQELNQRIEDFDTDTGDDMNFIHVRGTDVINAMVDNTVFTLHRTD